MDSAKSGAHGNHAEARLREAVSLVVPLGADQSDSVQPPLAHSERGQSRRPACSPQPRTPGTCCSTHDNFSPLPIVAIQVLNFFRCGSTCSLPPTYANASSDGPDHDV